MDSEHRSSGSVAVTLPNLRSKPTFEELCNALEGLTVEPTTWSTDAPQKAPAEDVKDVNDYLLSVISSSLTWFKDGSDDNTETDPKEVIWDLASKRMAERCGRSAMPEMTRTWLIPASETHPELKLVIREPPLTGDNLGLKTWGTAFAISKKIEELGNKYFHHLINGSEDYFTTGSGSTLTMPKMRVLELGSGTGLVGIAAAAVWKVSVVLTDLPDIQGNLLFNVRQNSNTVNNMGGSITCTVLDVSAHLPFNHQPLPTRTDNEISFNHLLVRKRKELICRAKWKNTEGALADLGGQDFEAVIAADPLYDDDHPELVSAMIKKYLKHNRSSRALIAIPMRDKGTRAMVRRLIELMRANSFQLSAQGEELFKDDWIDANDEGTKCWWSIWCWNLPWSC